MARFIVRRLLAMIGVLFAISVMTFLIFQAIPNGDPAVRLGGRTSTPETRAAIRKDWGFDKPIYEQYFITMGKVFDGSIVSYQQQINVEDEIRRDLPATLSLAIGAGIIWLGFGILFGVISAVKAGKFTDTSLTVLALIGVSMPVFLLGALVLWLLAYKVQIFPAGGYVPVNPGPVGVVHAPDPAVVRALGALHRFLLQGPAIEHPRHDQRGLRADGEGEGSERAPDPDPPRAPQLADPGCLAVRPRLRGGDRRRRDPHGDGLQPPGGRAVRRQLDSSSSTCRRCW